MDEAWLKGNKFHPISGTVYLLQVGLKKAPDLDVHVNVTFENATLQRCDLHGTIRLFKDAQRLRKTNDPNAVGRAIWVYSDKTWRSPVGQEFWQGKGGLTYTGLKTACRELATLVKEWEYEIGKADCDVLEPSKANAQKIAMIGVSVT